MKKEIVLEENLIRKKKIPVLIMDKEWKALFNEYMTKTMKKTVEELEEKISEEKQAIVQMKILKKNKKALMEKVLKLSDDINTSQRSDSLIKLEQTKQEILETNEKIDELEYALEILPKEIEQLNLSLLKETIQVAYTDIVEGNERLKSLTKEILDLRDKLTNSWEEKLSLEERTATLYSYLHNTLGHEETDKLDKRFL